LLIQPNFLERLLSFKFNAGPAVEWTLQLGPRAQNSPSIGDLDGDGKLDIVLGSYDGNVWVLSGGAKLYLPTVMR
jgi:hypothetical protein